MYISLDCDRLCSLRIHCMVNTKLENNNMPLDLIKVKE